MIDRVLIDTLNLKSRDFALKWKDQIRNAPQLKHYQTMDDETLIEVHKQIYPLLARTLDRGLDRSHVGGFFVKMGKERLRTGFPVSELIYGLNLAQKVVIEYLMTEFAPENPMRMYQSLGALTKVSEFFLLGSFYLIKGFLEETYTRMSVHDQVSEELLKKYFRDDFFFKNS
ncbi:MAG: hypothetical protein LBH44_12600 [Treponema sp.]|jgi:hypothetical protein|nr:hypothetical protein [Treponema sp.]